MNTLTKIEYFKPVVSVLIDACIKEALEYSKINSCICRFKFNDVDMEIYYNKYTNFSLQDQIDAYVKYYEEKCD